jgi:threonine dehydratase
MIWPKNTSGTWWAGILMLAKEERLLRFVFPERPGALLKFLSLMRPGWNISLFHYRNQGADYGRILVGLQVPRRISRL